MKRVIALVLTLAIVTTLFAFNVFADTVTTPQYVGRVYSTTQLADGVSVYYRATQFTPVIGQEIVNVSGSPGIKVYDAYTPILVTVKFQNTTDYNYKIDTIFLDLYVKYLSNFPTGYGISQGIKEIVNYSPDLLIAYNYQNGTSLTVMPTVNWSEDDRIVVPANSDLVALAEIRFNAYYQYGSGGYETRTPTLDSIEDYLTPGATITQRDPIGVGNGSGASSSQITQIVDLLDSIDSTNASIYSSVDGLENMVTAIGGSVDQLEGYTDEIEGLLYNIRSLLTWSGNYPVITYSTHSVVDFNGTVSGDVKYHIERNYGGSHVAVNTVDFEPPDDTYSYQIYEHTLVFLVDIQNNGNNDLDAVLAFKLEPFVASPCDVQLSGFYSDTFVNPYLYSYNSGYNFYVYLPATDPVLRMGHNRYVVYFKVYSTSNSLYFYNTSITTSNTFSVHSDPLLDESNAAAQQSDQIHQQEEVWYNQNKQAMESVGLSNFQFSNQQYNGILGVTFQFEQLWNALGSWTLVYIFTLLLSLATFIIRHRPTTKMQQRMDEREQRMNESQFWTNTNRTYRMLKDPDYAKFVQWRARNR